MKTYLKLLFIQLAFFSCKNEKNSDYESTLDFIFTRGFTLVEKAHAEKYNKGKFASLFNHIFKRVQ